MDTLEIEVGNPARPDDTRSIVCAVDSGSMFSVIPRAILAELGIRPFAKHTFRLADGSEIAREKGSALFRYSGRVGGADVIFGEENDVNLLGAMTLAALGFALDPLRRELRDLPMILAALPHAKWGEGTSQLTAPDTPRR